MNPSESSANIGEAATELRAVLSPLNRRLQARRFDTELTIPQISVLSLLDKGGPATPAALAAKDLLPPQSMATLLSQLHRKGLVTRSPSPSDGRSIVVAISPRGAEVMNAERRERARRLQEAMNRALSPQELEQIIRAIPLLERLTEFI
jgi:DNA-binding MarR family transcriptional regulator